MWQSALAPLSAPLIQLALGSPERWTDGDGLLLSLGCWSLKEGRYFAVQHVLASFRSPFGEPASESRLSFGVTARCSTSVLSTQGAVAVVAAAFVGMYPCICCSRLWSFFLSRRCMLPVACTIYTSFLSAYMCVIAVVCHVASSVLSEVGLAAVTVVVHEPRCWFCT